MRNCWYSLRAQRVEVAVLVEVAQARRSPEIAGFGQRFEQGDGARRLSPPVVGRPVATGLGKGAGEIIFHDACYFRPDALQGIVGAGFQVCDIAAPGAHHQQVGPRGRAQTGKPGQLWVFGQEVPFQLGRGGPGGAGLVDPAESFQQIGDQDQDLKFLEAVGQGPRVDGQQLVERLKADADAGEAFFAARRPRQ